MTTSMLRSQPINITPERKEAFREFMLSLPRECSPTICGIVTLPSGNGPPANDKSTDAMDISMDTSKSGIFESSLDVANPSGLWTIDEYAELYGTDFDNVHELDTFHEYESEHLSDHFTDESNRFFSQPSINPSPLHPSFCPPPGISEGSENKENKHRSTGSFVRYIEGFGVNVTLTTQTVPMCSELEDYPEDEEDEVDSGNFNSKSESSSEITPKKKGQKKISFVDSDFVSGTTMDLSLGTSAITCGGFSKFESLDLQAKFSRYFDFSPISPISRRPPLVSLRSMQQPNQNPAHFPVSSQGPNLSLVQLDISPIVPLIGTMQSKLAQVTASASKPFPSGTSHHGSCTPIGQQISSPMCMSIDDLSAIGSPAKMAQELAPTVGCEMYVNQQHWDDALPPLAGHSLCDEAVFKTPASKPKRKRMASRRTKLAFNECTSTPN